MNFVKQIGFNMKKIISLLIFLLIINTNTVAYCEELPQEDN